MNEFIALKWKDKLCRSLNLNLQGLCKDECIRVEGQNGMANSQRVSTVQASSR